MLERFSAISVDGCAGSTDGKDPEKEGRGEDCNEFKELVFASPEANCCS